MLTHFEWKSKIHQWKAEEVFLITFFWIIILLQNWRATHIWKTSKDFFGFMTFKNKVCFTDFIIKTLVFNGQIEVSLDYIVWRWHSIEPKKFQKHVHFQGLPSLSWIAYANVVLLGSLCCKISITCFRLYFRSAWWQCYKRGGCDRSQDSRVISAIK